MIEPRPELWSDFDGTAVKIAKKTDPRNWSKYPLPGVKGYADFLRGVHESGVEVAGIVSRRPNIFLRRLATSRSVSKLGYSEFFGSKNQIVLTGSEEAKGRFVVERSRETPVAMVEDKPHKLGSVLLGALTEPLARPEIPHHPILLGVVHHPRSQEYVESLYQSVNRLAAQSDLQVTQTGPMTALGMTIVAEQFALHVVQLSPYAEYIGQEFGQKLIDLSTSNTTKNS